ncbi:hypothetical protein O7621_27310 [Solwaraspora sp. WMMD937]|uniref:hypothetical protein n=1 Tax=Solwaraspora sp. WMMD937 TaxID=3016090 RepID=UPI00249A863E|nr:hypothetical protein [Solwaraspora sp. WMMD937]WFE21492.1 hypothetical protein O7621_27310 [Solwaraspora sp. WMMD937]
MAAVHEEVPFSDFLHRPGAAAERLNEVRTLRLRRRDADDLALVRADQVEREAIVVDFTARLLAGLVRSGSVEAVRRVLEEALPWVTFLPESDVDELLSELITVAQGAASLENLSPIATLLGQWRHTAEIYSDPALLEIINREPEGDLGVVDPPEERQ